MKQAAHPDAEYVLVYDYPLHGKPPVEVLVPRDTVVVNVRYKPTGAIASQVILGGSSTLEFTVKETGATFTTNYGYMFALDTPENRSRLLTYRKIRQVCEDVERIMKTMLERVDTVAGPFEGVFSAGGEVAHDR